MKLRLIRVLPGTAPGHNSIYLEFLKHLGSKSCDRVADFPAKVWRRAKSAQKDIGHSRVTWSAMTHFR